jgi:two-component system, chemotaxis family, sensor kinase CheA
MVQEDPGLQELVSDFVTESREHLANVESDLLNLETGDTSGEDPIHRVFRAVHSVKGVAGFLGFENINRLSHTMESVLDLVRKGRLQMSGELATELLGATDLLRNLIEHVQESNTIPIDDRVARLQRFQNLEAAQQRQHTLASEPVDEIMLMPGEVLVEIDLVLPRLALASATAAPAIPDLVSALGRVVHGAAGLAMACAASDISRDPVRVQLATNRSVDSLRLALTLEADELRILNQGSALANAPAATTTEPIEPVVKEHHEPVPDPPAATTAEKGKPADRGKSNMGSSAPAEAHAESIRVSVLLLDRLMNLSGELVLGRNQLLQAQGAGNEKGVGVASARLNQVVSEMQEAIMQTRMQPVGSLFQRFPRVVRDLAGKLRKRCRLELEGRGVDLDRSILEALSDPLTHLVRNAVDHGMETPDERIAAKKEPEGVVHLVAAQQGGNVRITITDNGRGIDPARLRRKAVEKGVITGAEAQVMGDREAIYLIFAPGFSTAEKVTDVSGRGVGMDVVRSNIERLGGHVEVQSTLGRGTTIAITIPLTLAILPAMVIRSGLRRYVLAQANVAELVRIRGTESNERIVHMDGREVLRLRGRVLPLLRLANVLGEGGNETPDDTATIVVVEAGNLRYGLVVDAPPDAEEIVVKPLGRHMKGRVEYAGATILGDGRVAMILDATGIAESASLVANDGPEVDQATRDAKGDVVESTDMVLFRNHPSETFAVALGLVDRIQRVNRSAITEVGGRIVYAEGDRALPIVRLETVVHAKTPEPSERLSILVLRLGQQKFGVVAPLVEDIRSLAVHIDDRTLMESGVLGSFQMQERTVRMLDVSAVARTALPQLFVEIEQPQQAAPQATEAPRGPIRVLFAEDTKFFREHVSRTLRDAGFDVVAAADGDLAWKEIGKDDSQFDIVVTDVQMPNCDGLELTRRIRKTERLRGVPVVALTSLSSAEDESEGLNAGVNAYLVKLDDAALVRAVKEHAGGVA